MLGDIHLSLILASLVLEVMQVDQHVICMFSDVNLNWSAKELQTLSFQHCFYFSVNEDLPLISVF